MGIVQVGDLLVRGGAGQPAIIGATGEPPVQSEPPGRAPAEVRVAQLCVLIETEPIPLPVAHTIRNLADLKRVVMAELRAGRLHLQSLLAEAAESKPGQQAAPMEVQIQLNDLYEAEKRRHGRYYSQEKFMRGKGAKIWACDVKTFERYRRNVKAWRAAGLI